MIPKCIVLLILISTGCRRVLEESRSPRDTAAKDLVGVWDATMSLAKPYPLERGAPGAREVCGTFGFVENHGRVDGGTESGEPLQIGVYDLALKRIGLEWNGEAAFPVVLASSSLAHDSVRRAAAGDSVRIVLNPGGDERIVLLGWYDAQGIEGEWTAQSARGTASGAFSMHPHSTGRQPRRVCEG